MATDLSGARGTEAGQKPVVRAVEVPLIGERKIEALSYLGSWALKQVRKTFRELPPEAFRTAQLGEGGQMPGKTAVTAGNPWNKQGSGQFHGGAPSTHPGRGALAKRVSR